MDYDYANVVPMAGMESIVIDYYIPDTDLYLQCKALINTGADYIESSIPSNGEGC